MMTENQRNKRKAKRKRQKIEKNSNDARLCIKYDHISLQIWFVQYQPFKKEQRRKKEERKPKRSAEKTGEEKKRENRDD